MASETYEIRYSQEAVDDIKSLRSYDKKKILEGIEIHLRHEPTKTSRSRIKLMDQPFWCDYRLRIEDFRVYYDVEEEGKNVVSILRVLEKGQAETQKEKTHETN